MKNHHTLIALLSLMSFSVHAMQSLCEKQLKRNKVQKSELRDYFTVKLNIPFTSDALEEAVRKKEFPLAYSKIPASSWYLTVITIALPFENHPTIQESSPAEFTLKNIVNSHKGKLKKISYHLSSFKSIDDGTSICACYSFKNKKHAKKFLTIYASILEEFLNIYRKAWLPYNYEPFPHVVVAHSSYPEEKSPINLAAKKLCLKPTTEKIFARSRWIQVSKHPPHKIPFSSTID